MERYTVDNLADGTLEALKKKAIKRGFKLLNGSAALSVFVRCLLEKEAAKK